MEWTRSETLALAMHHCTQCHGSELRLGSKGACVACNCVLRAIFRICYDRFMRCVAQEKHLSRVSLEPHLGKNRPSTWGRKDEEYIADFCLVSRRVLDDSEHRLFRYHFLLGADWKLARANWASTAEISSMLSIGSSRNSGGCSASWNRTRCFLSMNTSAGPRGWYPEER
jgi:hypothetical protein